MSNAYWDRSALDAELANFSLAAMQHARSPRTDSSDSDFQAMFHDAARDLLAFAAPRDRSFVFDTLERICRIYPHCNGAEIARLRAAHESNDTMQMPPVAPSGVTERAAASPS